MSTAERYLIPVGFYRELRGGEPHEPSLHESVQRSSGSEIENVLRYINSGKVLIATGGVVSDVLDPAFGIIGPPHICTDGTYAWPAIFSHYIEHHHVRLPEDFASHMAANNWTIPSEIDLRSLKIRRSRGRS